jgi:hypothetical protein
MLTRIAGLKEKFYHVRTTPWVYDFGDVAFFLEYDLGVACDASAEDRW